LRPVFILPKPASNKVTKETEAFPHQAAHDAASLGELVDPLIFSRQPLALNANINNLNVGVD
jgi:hypothetical protein